MVGVYILKGTALRATLSYCPYLLQLLEPKPGGDLSPGPHLVRAEIRESEIQVRRFLNVDPDPAVFLNVDPDTAVFLNLYQNPAYQLRQFFFKLPFFKL